MKVSGTDQCSLKREFSTASELADQQLRCNSAGFTEDRIPCTNLTRNAHLDIIITAAKYRCCYWAGRLVLCARISAR